MKNIVFVSLLVGFSACGVESSTSEENPIPFELTFDTGVDRLSLPEGIREDLANYEDGVRAELTGLFVEGKAGRTKGILNSIEGEIQIANSDLLGTTLSVGGMLGSVVKGAVFEMVSGLTNPDAKDGLIDRAKSLNVESQNLVSVQVGAIEIAARSASLSKSFRLEYPKGTNLTEATGRAIGETMSKSVLFWDDSEALKKHQALYDYWADLELEKLQVQEALLSMNYFLFRNHPENRPEFVSALKTMILSGNKDFRSGERKLDLALENCVDLLVKLENPPNEIEELLEFGSESFLADFEEYNRLFRGDILAHLE